MRAASGIAACLAACATLPTSRAQAACGGVQTTRPQHGHAGRLPPLAVGDSTMLLALPQLRRHGFAADAHGCRQFPEALRLLRELRRAGRLPRLVVVALGADGVVTRANIRDTLAVLGPRRRLVLVTPLETGGVESGDARLVRSAAHLHPGRIDVLDWARHSRGHPGWFQPDRLHLTFTGADAFTRFLVRARPLVNLTPTVFGSVRFVKRNRTTRVATTLQLSLADGWDVRAARDAAGAPRFSVRRRGPCAARVILRASGSRTATAGPAAHSAGLVPAGASTTRAGQAGAARFVIFKNADGSTGGAWSAPLGDPFFTDADRTERAFLDVVAEVRAIPGSNRTCGRDTALRTLRHLRRLAA